MIPDFRTARVHREGSPPLRFAWAPALQPDDPAELRASLCERDHGPYDVRLRLCRLTDGQWRDEGPAPDLRDGSWHPDLTRSLAEYVVMARRVVASIGRCSSVSLFLEPKSSSGDHVLVGAAVFNAAHPGGPGYHGGIIDEHTLDPVPYVRHVERQVVLASTYFGIGANDDGSGYDGDLNFEIGPDSLELSFRDDDQQGVFLSSVRKDGVWTHATELRTIEHECDAVETMRRLRDPQRRMHAAADADSGIAHMVGDGVAFRTARVTSVEEPEEGSLPALTVFHVEPGTLLPQSER